MCGEKRKDRLDYYVPQGSPPHVRGKDMDTLQTVHDARITPACAGKSKLGQFISLPVQDHPRMCGEKPLLHAKLLPMQGSPPHVRGKVHLAALRLLCPGITPACAGKSRTKDRKYTPQWDHPRMCGEKTKKIP